MMRLWMQKAIVRSSALPGQDGDTDKERYLKQEARQHTKQCLPTERFF
jgi:hypothetical protein